VRCPLHRAQDASIRFVGEQLQKPGVLNVRLGKGQSAISDGAGVRHGLRQLQRELPIGICVAIDKVLQYIRNVVTIDIATTSNFEGDIP
jgi:hypothetical protein